MPSRAASAEYTCAERGSRFEFAAIQRDIDYPVRARLGVERPEELAPLELLDLYLTKKGMAPDRVELLKEVWDHRAAVMTRTVDMHVQRLRTKLGPAGDMIETVRGFGYRLRSGAPRGA